MAQAINDRQLELKIEPGRSLLDGCGMTVARVMYAKPCFGNASADMLVGLNMNETHHGTTFDDFLVDPLVIRRNASVDQNTPSSRGYFAGSYCTETGMISPRRFHFPGGIQTGDLVVFPNSAAYQMHFYESRSHQLHLPANFDVGTEMPDPIERLR